MLREAIEKICELSNPTVVHEEDGTILSDTKLQKFEPPIHLQNSINVYSLDALISLIKNETIEKYQDRKIFVEISNFKQVHVFLDVIDDEKNERVMLYTATELDVPGVPGSWMNYDEALIKIRSQFQDTKDKKYLLELLSKIDTENGVTSEDNGMSQTVTVRKGIAAKGIEQIKPIVSLKPYRTFMEVEQPESDFLVRIDDNQNIGLFEADGGMWKLAARKIIKNYLKSELQEQIKSEQVIVML